MSVLFNLFLSSENQPDTNGPLHSRTGLKACSAASISAAGFPLPLKKLDLTGQVDRVKPVPDKNQSAEDVADASLPLLAVHNAGVLNSGGSQAKKVIVIAEDDTVFGEAKAKLVLVEGPEKTHLGRRRHIDTATAESGSMEVDRDAGRHRPSHGLPVRV